MTTFRYDGSFAGLLTVLHRIFSWREEAEGIFVGAPAQDDLFAEAVFVETDPAQANVLLAAVGEHLSRETLRNLRQAFFSEAKGVEMLLYRYLAFGWKVRMALDEHIAHSDVAPVHRLVRRVRGEAHRFKGLLRFREISDGMLYAPMEPDYFILPLLASHFAARLSAERWLIHDLSRGKGVLYGGGRWLLADLQIEEKPDFTEEEIKWQKLWKVFFRHVAIGERVNPRRQRSFMPMKYWTYLVEMDQGAS